jgi:hypothetical protein
MSLWEFLKLAVVSPGKAFTQGRGRFLVASLILGVLAALPAQYFLGAADSLFFSLLYGLAISLVILLAEGGIYHAVGRVLFSTKNSYTEFMSIFGFTGLPAFFTALASALVLSFGLIRFRPVDNPILFSLSDPWFVGLLVFGYLMSVARLLYTGIALDAVYHLGWKRVVPTILISFLLLQAVVVPLTRSVLRTAPVSLGSIPVIVSGVQYVEADYGTLTVPYHAPRWERGETVVANMGPINVRGFRSSAVPLKSPYMIVELLALPGDNVAIIDGEVWVNDSVVFTPTRQLTQLNLQQRVLGAHQVLVYVQSPEALGTLMNAEQFVLSKDYVLGAPGKALNDLLRWVLK